MIKTIRHIIHHYFSRVFHLSGFLLIVLCASAQDGQLDTITSRLQRYEEQHISEKVFVHTDRSFYLAGESIWFSIYVVDASSHRPLGASSIVYVEIMNKAMKPVWQSGIAVKDGFGNGSLIVPLSFLSGNYTLRAYTNWMKNQSPDYYFHQDITIVNTFKSSVAADTTTRSKTFDLQFFPEGGSLVTGLPSVVAFKAVDGYGRGADCNGVVLRNNKDTVVSFQSFHLGMGKFSMTPREGDAYTVMANCNGQKVQAVLPAVLKNGYVMQLGEVNDKQVKLVVYSSASEGKLYLLAHNGKHIGYAASGMIHNGKATFAIDTSQLGEGINHLTVFDEAKNPVCERLYFKMPVNKLQIDAHTDKPNYSSRQPVSIDLTARDRLNVPQGAMLSVGIYHADGLQEGTPAEIYSYLWLRSELKGNIESPEYYFDAANPNALMALDNLLLTQGWRRFSWEQVLKAEKPAFDFIPEYSGPVITGIATNRKTGAIAPNMSFYLSVPGTAFEIRTATSRADGTIRFYCNPVYGRNEMVIQPVNSSDSMYRVNISQQYSDQFSAGTAPPFAPLPAWKDALSYRSINTQADNAFLQDKKQRTIAYHETDTLLFYGPPDHQYRLDEYTRFITMEEVMREFILDVRVRKKEDKFYFRVWDASLKASFDNDPLILLDGLPVTDADKIMHFDPLKIKTIEVLSHKFYLGNTANEGLVSYKTYAGDLGGYNIDPSAIVMEYDGLQQRREFYAPVYDTDEQRSSRIPDFRHLLSWMPEVHIIPGQTKQISLFTSDLKGKYMAFIQGITNSGLAGSQTIYFEVK